MPQIGTNNKPVVLKNKKKFYSIENKEKYDSGWDRIFNKDT